MATTTNFGWETPDDTDLVKDGALAMRTLGNAIDASLVDLKGGTTGQVLSKTSNTDMDFTWVTSDDANAIQNAIVDAKGDLITATAADTPSRIAVGNNGETLVADSSASTGLRWQGNFAAGKNKILNSDFSIWQRGTSFSGNAVYTADRWLTDGDRTGTAVSRQTFTPASAPVAGYEGQFYARYTPGTGGTYSNLQQRIEDVRTFAGQTVTLSYWARISTGTITNEPAYIQNFGSGGSGSNAVVFSSVTITTTWQRFTHTLAIDSISGKTVGTSSYLNILPLRFSSASSANIDIWGVQIETGNVATAFQTATGTLAGELAACQRYYEKTYIQGTAPATATSAGMVGPGITSSANAPTYLLEWRPWKVEKRGTPTITTYDDAGNIGKCTFYSTGAVPTNNQGLNVDSISATSARFYVGGGSAGFFYHYIASAEL